MAQQIQRCRVTSGFRHKGEIQGPGTVLDLEKALAYELQNANKLEFVASDTKLVHKTELPNPNDKFAARIAARAAAQKASAEAAMRAAGAK